MDSIHSFFRALGIGNYAIGPTKLTAMISLSDYQTVASEYTKQLMNQTHFNFASNAPLTFFSRSFFNSRYCSSKNES